MKLVCSIPENKIDEFFPNLKLVSALILDIFPYDKEEEKIINKSLSSASNYEELSKIIFKLGYTRKQEKLSDTEKNLLLMTESLESRKQTKNIIAHKDELNKLIKKKQELDHQLLDCEIKIIKVEISLNTERINIDNHNNIIADSSSNIFKRIINGKKIKESTTIINESDLKAKDLELQKEELIKKTNEIKEELASIEKEFKTITNLDYFSSSESFMQIYYESDYNSNETELENLINNLKQEIERLTKELDELIQTGLIIFDDNQLDDNDKLTILETESFKPYHPKL